MSELDTIKALEILNKETIQLKGSTEFNLGKKLVRLKRELKQGKIKLQFERLKKKIMLNKITEAVSDNNVDEETWKEQLRLGNKSNKVVIYTCITGDYDVPMRPLYFPSNVEFILFTDNLSLHENSNGWKVKQIPQKLLGEYNAALTNRYIKLHPHELFSEEFGYSIYIDGNIRPVSDLSLYVNYINSNIGMAFHKHASRNCIYEEVKSCLALGKGNPKKLKEQIEKYKYEGFPKNFGMLECNVIVNDLKSDISKNIFDAWWKEIIRSDSGRDQLALPYILWDNGFDPKSVSKLGANVYKNAKLQVVDHK